MAKKKAKNRFGMASLIAFAVIAVSLILVIVGYTIDWMKLAVTAGEVGQDTFLKLSELAETHKELGGLAESTMKGFPAMNTFSIITLIAVIASAGCFVVSSILRLKLFKLITALVGLATIVCAIVLIITSFSFADNYKFAVGSIASMKVSPAAGPWLMTIFGVIGGGATAAGAMKK